MIHLPSAEILGPIFGLSEIGISLLKRSKTPSAGKDRGSLLVLWIAIIASIAVAMLVRRWAPPARIPAGLYPVGFTLYTLGLLLRWYAIIYLGRFFTVNVAIADDHRVVDTGPYRFVRHPSYSGALLAFLGFGICLGNFVSLLALLVPIGLAFGYRIRVEEQALVAALGDNYRTYRRRTRRLVPFLY